MIPMRTSYLPLRPTSLYIATLIIVLGFSLSWGFGNYFKKVFYHEPIAVLDQTTEADILDVQFEKKSDLVKGSFLDYDATYVTYQFAVDNKVYKKTELIKDSDWNLSQVFNDSQNRQGHLTSTTVWIRYSSQNPRLSVIDISKPIAAY